MVNTPAADNISYIQHSVSPRGYDNVQVVLKKGAAPLTEDSLDAIKTMVRETADKHGLYADSAKTEARVYSRGELHTSDAGDAAAINKLLDHKIEVRMTFSLSPDTALADKYLYAPSVKAKLEAVRAQRSPSQGKSLSVADLKAISFSLAEIGYMERLGAEGREKIGMDVPLKELTPMEDRQGESRNYPAVSLEFTQDGYKQAYAKAKAGFKAGLESAAGIKSDREKT